MAVGQFNHHPNLRNIGIYFGVHFYLGRKKEWFLLWSVIGHGLWHCGSHIGKQIVCQDDAIQLALYTAQLDDTGHLENFNGDLSGLIS